MRINVLGPVQLSVNGQTHKLPRLERMLLAALVAHVDHIVTIENLVDALWENGGPPSARNRVQTLVGTIRRAAGPAAAALVTRSPGYQVFATGIDLDATEFEQAVAHGRRLLVEQKFADANRALATGLLLWRGGPFEDAESRLIRGCALRLNELRWKAIEERVHVQLAIGEHHEVVAEALQLLAVQPFRQRLRGQLMLALYRCERQPEALELYRQGVTLLAEEHGLDPGAELQDLHRAILRGDLELAWRPRPHHAVPAQLPALPGTFVGRESQLERLDTFRHERLVTLTGGPGVGKTTLAVHWAHRAAKHFPDGQIYINLRGFDPGGRLVSTSDALRTFLIALDVPQQQIPPDLSSQIGMYRTLLASRRMLIVLDNARDAAHAEDLIPGSQQCTTLVTSRDQLTALVARGARPVSLEAMDVDEAVRLLHSRLGTARLAGHDVTAKEIISLSAGLPLAIAVFAARASVHPRLALVELTSELRRTRNRLDAFTAGEPATDARAVFSWSYNAVSAAAARLFRLIGLHPGPDIDSFAAASLAGLPCEQVRVLLSELTRAHLLNEHMPGRFAFHDLLRLYAAELVSDVDDGRESRDAVQRMLDFYLTTGHEAALLLDPHRPTIGTSQPAAGVANAELSGLGVALAWFDDERAAIVALIEIAAQTEFDTHAWQLAWTLSDYFQRRGHWDEWHRTQRLGHAATIRLGDLPAQATMCTNIARVSGLLGRFDDASAYLIQALELDRQLGDKSKQASRFLGLSWVRERQERHFDALDAAGHALELYRAAGDRRGEAFALNNLGSHYSQLSEYEQAIAHCEQSLRLHQDLGDVKGQADVWDSLGAAHHGRGTYAEAMECYREAVTLNRKLGDRLNEADALVHLGDAHAAADDHVSALEAWRKALKIFELLGAPAIQKVKECQRRITA